MSLSSSPSHPIPAARTSQIKRSWGHPSGSQNRLENGWLGGARSTPVRRRGWSVPSTSVNQLPYQERSMDLWPRRRAPLVLQYPGDNPRLGRLGHAAKCSAKPPIYCGSPPPTCVVVGDVPVRHSPVPRLGAERQDMSSTLGRASVATSCWYAIPPCLPRESKVRPEVLLQRARLGNLSAGSLEAVGKGLSRFAAAAAGLCVFSFAGIGERPTSGRLPSFPTAMLRAPIADKMR
ncbi:hypothetical protein CKAH01_04489 [Colletotrichum kahawae]|uniref:Uncharacterized protein n=1 Tax=Colletotrichum kahawae TaxID=34407 RepID=A0AAE0D820_COLKA|nr:hypothetical protein CKAH01_04489 [Colletotrichum kahawae]